MDSDALREQLLKLHAELGAAQRVDPQSNQLLGDIMEDIKRLMQQPADPAVALTTPQSLPDRLENIAVQFEADHPTLAASSRRLVDLLGKAGL
jgi:Domain of unknown function (DUF4404)